VDIIQDTCPGQPGGVLIMHPRYPLAAVEPTKLFPGTFEEKLIDGVLYIRPKHDGPYWIASLSLKKILLKRHNDPPAIIVPVSAPPDAVDREASCLKR
jgi:hypothetical protein